MVTEEERNALLNVNRHPILALAVALAALSAPACQRRWNGLVLSHGAEIDVKNYSSPGRYTIVDFFSDDCPACVQLSPALERLDLERRDVVLVKVDVDRPGSRGIDWGSPVARQYDLHALPHLRIYGKDGQLELDGDAAIERALSWIGRNQGPM